MSESHYRGWRGGHRRCQVAGNDADLGRLAAFPADGSQALPPHPVASASVSPRKHLAVAANDGLNAQIASNQAINTSEPRRLRPFLAFRGSSTL